MKHKIDCFIPFAGEVQVMESLKGLSTLEQVGTIYLLTTDSEQGDSFDGNPLLVVPSLSSTQTLKVIASCADSEYTLIYTKHTSLDLGLFALERMLRIASDSGAGMVYSDHYRTSEKGRTNIPVIDYQKGSLRDDFDFGSVILYNTVALKEAVSRMDVSYQYAGLYDLRLKVSQQYDLVHINEYLYTERENDSRKNVEKMFDYVDPKNRASQIEFEQACTNHLKVIGGYLEPTFKAIRFDAGDFEYEASVIIPVRNRISTLEDAIKSVLKQKTSFKFNLIIVDNHSTDGTTELIRKYSEDERLIHTTDSYSSRT